MQQLNGVRYTGDQDPFIAELVKELKRMKDKIERLEKAAKTPTKVKP